MPSFQIATYEVATTYTRRTSGNLRERTLRMEGPVLYHGIQNRAAFAFSDLWNGTWDNPVAGYLSSSSSGLSLVAWLPTAEFSYFYDLIRAEKPILISYAVRDSGATAGYLRSVGLGTADEPVGEGPAESEAAIARVLERRVEDRLEVIPMPQRDLVVTPADVAEDLAAP